jgi:hypothetical protein
MVLAIFMLWRSLESSLVSPPETSIHSFIVKIWVEDSQHFPGERRWHGSTTHVPSNVKIYISHLDELLAFIQRMVGEDVFKSQTG